MKNLWDFIQEKTKFDRGVCKEVVFALLYNGMIIDVCQKNILMIEDVIEIRMAFDDYMLALRNERKPV
jgi:hypothetical protein